MRVTVGEVADWPPDPSEVWVVHGTMGSEVLAFNDDGGSPMVLLRVASSQNLGGDEVDDRTFMLDDETAAQLLATLLVVTRQTFDRGPFLALMAATLDVPIDDVP